jgi:hypothetical protein
VAIVIDETLSIIKKSKHPKNGEYKEQNGKTYAQEDKRSTKEGKPLGNIKFPKPLLSTRSISNKEKGGPPERMPSLEEPSLASITHFKIKIA